MHNKQTVLPIFVIFVKVDRIKYGIHKILKEAKNYKTNNSSVESISSSVVPGSMISPGLSCANLCAVSGSGDLSMTKESSIDADAGTSFAYFLYWPHEYFESFG